MDFINMKSLFIDGQEVKTLSINNKIVWKKSSGWKGLKFTAEEPNCSMYFSSSDETKIPIRLEYSLDDGLTCETYTNAHVISLDNIGDSVCFRCNGIGQSSYEDISSTDAKFYISNGKIKSSGNIMSIKSKDDFDETTNVNDFAFRGLFLNCNSLTEPPELPATTLATYCYAFMFRGCKSLTKAPELPATTLASYCYNNMFNGCTSLTSAPELPATTLSVGCYNTMFQNCTSLTQAPELPATTLADFCYYNMFYNCRSLTKAPELPATTLASQCYTFMFYGCTSLTQVPSVLPATTLTFWCYANMFGGCSSLTKAPELPATTLTDHCYFRMFWGCTSLTSAPVLPATNLTDYCYTRMFQGCTSMKRIKMNASSGSLGDGMFYGCTSLELVDMTGSTGVPTLSNVNNFQNTNDTYKVVVPDSLYDTWISATNWASIASHIMKQSDWNAAHPDDILG